MVHDTISEHWSCEFGRSWRNKRVNLCHETVSVRYSVVDSQVGAFDVGGPHQAGPRLIVERSNSAMTDTKHISILLGRVGNLVEVRNAIVTRKLEDVSLVLNDIDVDVATLKRVDTSPSVYRVLILVDLDHIVEFVWAILIAAKVVQVEPVGFPTLAGDNTNALDVPTRELTWK